MNNILQQSILSAYLSLTLLNIDKLMYKIVLVWLKIKCQLGGLYYTDFPCDSLPLIRGPFWPSVIVPVSLLSNAIDDMSPPPKKWIRFHNL